MSSYVENHCHILPTGMNLHDLFLGETSSREDVLALVAARHAELDPVQWLHAVHYDQNRFPDGIHLTRRELDAISAERPILLRHQSGHASVANSAALKAAGIREDEPNPGGGEFVRDEKGWMTGVLLEDAHDRVTQAKPRPTREQMVDMILTACESMAGYGISAACDMMTGFYDLEDELWAYRTASERGCKVTLHLYLQWATVFGPRAMAPERLREHLAQMDPARCRMAGIKIFADGAISAATAATYDPYPNGGTGQLIYSRERLHGMVKTAHDAGYQVATHAIGDRAVDEVMDAYEAAGDASRHRIEHATMLSDAQIERLARIGCFVTMQPEFLVAFGPSYRRQLGDERTSKLKRYRSALDGGVKLSLSSDRPIVSGDPLIGVRAAAKRPDGFDPSENLTMVEAVDLYSATAALAFLP